MQLRLLILTSLILLTGCGKFKRSENQTAAPSTPAPATSIKQWSGRSDLTNDVWQIKSKP